MSSLKSFSDRDLLERTKHLSAEERKLTTRILDHLREIEARRLYAKLGYSSLIEYCMKELNYSEGAAYRRVQAMRLIRELPEAKAQVESGALSLNQLAQAQTFFRKVERELSEPKPVAEKRSILNQLNHQTTRTTEQILSKLEPRVSVAPKESVKPAATGMQLSVHLPVEVFKQIEKLQIFYQGRKTFAEIIALLVNDHLERIEKSCKTKAKSDKAQTAKRENLTKNLNKDENPQLAKNRSTSEGVSGQIEVSDSPTASGAEVRSGSRFAGSGAEVRSDSRLASFGSKVRPDRTLANSGAEVISQQRLNSRYIAARIRRAVFERAGGQCEFVSPVTRRRCEARRYLEFDHRTPFAKGGAHSNDNLRMLCRAHNQLHALECYGQKKMNQYLS